MKVVGVIQARMGSTRLPGKMMFLLNDNPVISHVIQRVEQASALDEVVLATSTLDRDDLLESEAEKSGIGVYRGSESDVLKRVHNAAAQTNADIVVRICADNPLISPDCISEAADTIVSEDVDYASYSVADRTLPLGVTAEAFTMNSFALVESGTDEQYEREHVTIFYRENPSMFSLSHIDGSDVFTDSKITNRSDLRLTLDTAADYELHQRVYKNVTRNRNGIIDLHDAIEYIDTNGLSTLNSDVEQKDPTENE